MRRESSEIQTKSTVDGAEAVIAAAIREHHEAAKLRPGATPEGYAKLALRNLQDDGFEIVRKSEAGRVVVLDEAGERKLQDLLAGKSVPTGRIVEVTYRMPDGTKMKHRHAEFGSLDKVSYDPPPVIGAEIAGATVLKATETVQQAAPAEGVSGYDKAIDLLRERIPGVAAVDEALGEASPNGPEGNVWKLLDQRYATTRIGQGLWTEDSLHHDVLEVRNGMLVMRPGSPLARLFADRIPLEFTVGGIRLHAYCTPGQRDELKAKLESICSYPADRRAY